MTEFTDEGLHQQAIAAAKSKFKIWPSAYASGWMTRHYRQLYKAKKGRSGGAFKGRSDSLKTWFAEDWKAINSSGKIVGGCGDGVTKGKVKCLPAAKARSLSKKDRSTLAKRKQKQDPNPDREGAPVMVSSKRRDSMSPEVFAQAILSIEQNYGLRLDARSVWLRMDDWKRLGRDQMGQKCGRGWHGLRGACKRVPKGGDKDAAMKASKLALADKIRARKGLRDRNAPKAVAKVEKTKAVTAKAKKMTVGDTTREEISSLTKTDLGKSIITSIAQNADGSTSLMSGRISEGTGYPAMHFTKGQAGIDIGQEVEKTVRTLRNKIYPDLDDSQILKRLKKTVTTEDKHRLKKNNLVHRLGSSEEQAEIILRRNSSHTDSSTPNGQPF